MGLVSKRIDRQLAEDLYRRYGFQVERRCLRILHDPERAADAAQEVFIKLMEKGAGFEGRSEWMTWLYRVSTNICLNRLRDAKRKRARQEQIFKEAERGPIESGAESTLDRKRMLQSQMQRSDRKTQQIVLYYFWDQMSQEEIGKIMKLSRVSVNKRLQKFRRGLSNAVSDREMS